MCPADELNQIVAKMMSDCQRQFSFLFLMTKKIYGGGHGEGSEHRNTAKKINEHLIFARKVNKTLSP